LSVVMVNPHLQALRDEAANSADLGRAFASSGHRQFNHKEAALAESQNEAGGSSPVTPADTGAWHSNLEGRSSWRANIRSAR
jgi:hypothetical protein